MLSRWWEPKAEAWGLLSKLSCWFLGAVTVIGMNKLIVSSQTLRILKFFLTDRTGNHD
jgi:hypothetical protein